MKVRTSLFAALLLTIIAFAKLVRAAPANDNFVDRRPLIGSITSVVATNCGATKEAGEPNHAGLHGGSSVWWSWTARASGGQRLTSGEDVVIAIYTGTLVDRLQEVISGRQSILFYARAGVTYAVALDTLFGSCGNVSFATYPEPAPSNDLFADRLLLPGNRATVTVANEAARSEPAEPCHAGTPPYRSLWWSWTAPATGRYAVSAEGYAWPARVAVYTGDRLENLSPVAEKASPAHQQPAQVFFD